MNKRVTLSDVAERAGVSKATVSAVLSGKAGKSIRVSETRMMRVFAAANALGYVPNTAAQQLKSGDDNHIIVVFTYENMFPADPKSEYYLFFAGIQQEAEREGYDILILNNWAKEKSRSSRIRLASGAIMIGVTRDDMHITGLVKQQFPLVFVGRREIGKGLPVNFVSFEYFRAVDDIVRIVSRFSDRLIYISSRLSNAEPSADKSLYLHQSCSDHGITIEDVLIENSVTEESLKKVLSSKVVIFDRLFIADLFTPVFKERNLVIGKDVFGAILEDDWTESHEEWTSWENRRMELGALAVKRLIAFLSGKDVDAGKMVEMDVVERLSTSGV